jgi:hypothetical protein
MDSSVAGIFSVASLSEILRISTSEAVIERIRNRMLKMKDSLTLGMRSPIGNNSAGDRVEHSCSGLRFERMIGQSSPRKTYLIEDLLLRRALATGLYSPISIIHLLSTIVSGCVFRIAPGRPSFEFGVHPFGLMLSGPWRPLLTYVGSSCEERMLS